MTGDFLATIASGGPVIVLLIALSVASLTLIVAKIVGLWSCRSGAALREAALAKWRASDKPAAIATLATGKSPADRVLQQAMTGLVEGIARAPLDEELSRLGNLEVDAMNRHIRLLELVAMISPLLGLLGTVLGMIESFRGLAMAEGSANASVLAGGIWEALLTTAAGLIVAIPAGIAASLLAERVERAGLLIESAVGQLYLAEFGRGGRRS